MDDMRHVVGVFVYQGCGSTGRVVVAQAIDSRYNMYDFFVGDGKNPNGKMGALSLV